MGRDKRNAKNIVKISDERKQMELEGILVDPNRPLGAAMLIKTGLAEAIFPGFVGKEAKLGIHVLSQLRKKIDFPLAMACFFVGFPPEFALEKCVTLQIEQKPEQAHKISAGQSRQAPKDSHAFGRPAKTFR